MTDEHDIEPVLETPAGTATAPTAHVGKVDRRILDLLVCPLTKTALIYDAERQELISRAAGLAFPIVDGMPVMVPTEARPLSGDEPALRR